MGNFFGGSGHGPESSCQISAYYKFFPGFSVFRISTGLKGKESVTMPTPGEPLNSRLYHISHHFDSLSHYTAVGVKVPELASSPETRFY